MISSYKISLFAIFLFVLGSLGCKKELKLESQEPFGQSALVFSGGLVAPLGPHVVKVSTSGDGTVQTISPFTQLEITLFKEGQAIQTFQEVTPGEYNIPFGLFSINQGEKYHIEAKLISGEIIQSKEFIVPVNIPGVRQLKTVSTFGRTPPTHAANVQGNLVEIYTDFTPQNPNQKGYLNYYLEDAVYSMEDKVCHPLDPAITCYFKVPDPESQFLRLIDLGELQDGKVNDFRLLTQIIDFKFDLRHSFLFKQQIINKEYYDFLINVKKITQNDNDIFGTIPGNVDGNMFSLADPSRSIFGMLTAVYENELSIGVTQNNLPGVVVQGYCDIINSQVQQAECCDCGRIRGAFFTKPFWF